MRARSGGSPCGTGSCPRRRRTLTVALVLGALLAVAAVWFVARPFFAGPGAGDRLEEPDSDRLAFEERRDRALGALKELEFDHRTGKVSDEDYRRQVGELRRAAADALRALDSGTARTDARADDQLPQL